MFKMTLATAFSALLFTACTTLGIGDSNSNVTGSGSDSCDRTGSGLTCSADSDCASDEECEDGTCKLHGSVCDSDDDDSDDDDDDDDDSDDTDADDDDGGPNTWTTPLGGACTFDSECVSDECEHGVCAIDADDDDGGPQTYDTPIGEACTFDSQCVGDECEDGICAPGA